MKISYVLATAGHANIVSRLIDHDANIEAQSERTKDTALSLACSGGRQEVVEILLKNGANREHRNVSDYTGLSRMLTEYSSLWFVLFSVEPCRLRWIREHHQATAESRRRDQLEVRRIVLRVQNSFVFSLELAVN